MWTRVRCLIRYFIDNKLALICCSRHWVVDAAIAWKGYGTRVTGYDVVDMSEGLLLWAAEQGVSESIRFVRGNL